MNKLLLLLLLATGLLLSACGSDDDTPVATDGDTTTTAPPATGPPDTDPPDPSDDAAGTIAVHIEEVEGFFIEGFEVGLRFETADGEVIASTLWGDFVAAEGDGSLESFYESVLEQPVPAGDVVVLATANVGAGPPPETPDIEGDLRCRLEVTVPEGDTVEVEVNFSGTDDCLTLR